MSMRRQLKLNFYLNTIAIITRTVCWCLYIAFFFLFVRHFSRPFKFDFYPSTWDVSSPFFVYVLRSALYHFKTIHFTVPWRYRLFWIRCQLSLFILLSYDFSVSIIHWFLFQSTCKFLVSFYSTHRLLSARDFVRLLMFATKTFVHRDTNEAISNEFSFDFASNLHLIIRILREIKKPTENCVWDEKIQKKETRSRCPKA